MKPDYGPEWEALKLAAVDVKQYRGTRECDHPQCARQASRIFSLSRPQGGVYDQRYYACMTHQPPGCG